MANFKTGDEISRILRRERRIREGVQPVLESGVDIKTVNSESLVGPGNLVVESAPASTGYQEGASFPVSPATGDKFYRTDLNWLCFYDGTHWLTCHEYSEQIALGSAIFFTVNNASGYAALNQSFRPYLTTLTANLRVSGTNNGSNYWTMAFVSYSATSTKTTISSFNTASYSGGNYQSFKQTINAPVNSGDFFLGVDLTKTGSPGTLGIFCSIQYRLIVT